MIVICPKCHEKKRAYSPNFRCCGESHNSKANDAFPPKIPSQAPSAPEPVKEPESQTSTSDAALLQNTTGEKPSPSPTTGNAASSSSQSKNHAPRSEALSSNAGSKAETGVARKIETPQPTAHKKMLELETPIEELKEEKQKMYEDYAYICGDCKAAFDEHEGKCPHCGEEFS